MNQDAAFQELSTAFTDFKTSVNASFDNVAADVKALEAKLSTMGDLSPTNEEIRQGMLADFATLKARGQEVANIEPDATPEP